MSYRSFVSAPCLSSFFSSLSSSGTVVQLNPDPIKTPIDKSATLTTLNAGTRQFRKRTDTKFIQSLALNADPTKGPFHCEFQLGGFALKLLSVSVRCKNNTTRVTCKVEEASTGRSRNVFLYFKADGSISHRSFELRKANNEQKDGTQELFFVTIDSITVDKNTGVFELVFFSLFSFASDLIFVCSPFFVLQVSGPPCCCPWFL
jgi:hypothetical protein